MASPERQIITNIPFSDEMDGGRVQIEVQSTENGTDVWLRQGQDVFCFSPADWAKIKQSVDATLTAFDGLEAALFQKSS